MFACRASRQLGAVAFVALIGPFALAGCTDEPTASPTSDVTIVATSTTRPDDGTLLVGVVLPTSSGADELGSSMSTAVRLALKEINAAGGVNGRDVRLLTREEGDNAATAALAVQDLLQLGVDAIVGPASSTDTLGTLGAAVEAGVLTCSPTASALALDAFPDNGLFLRTIPSDSLQASALAAVLEASGSNTAAVVYLDDAYGRPFAAATEAALAAEGTEVSASVGFTLSDDSLSAAVAEVAATDPEVVVVIADAVSGPTVINAMDDGITTQPTYVVNDAIRRPATTAPGFSVGLARRVVGVSPLAYSGSTEFLDALRTIDPTASGLYAHNAYDCLNIIALAAQAAGSSRPLDISLQLTSVTASGTSCDSFPACNESLAEARNINYDGPSGNLSIGPDGDMITALFERFTFQRGRDITTGTVAVGSG
ncbi:MAG: ABC transporter substrate-binding protein [Actinomycetota bacterium]|nr:ABC transporter substrate-binding protein [Actinomycetota bacterium]